MPPDYHLRLACPDDASMLAVLATQVWLHTYATEGISTDIAGYVLSALTPDQYRASMQMPSVRLLVAERQGALIGFAQLHLAMPCPCSAAFTAELQTLYVQAPFIGHGVGKALLQAADALARAQGGTALWLTVNAGNRHAVDFYARQGYTQIGTTYFELGDTRHENHVLAGPVQHAG